MAGGASREDTGHAIFRSDTGAGIACVACHPGGADDGRVWRFSSGARRTQTLQGTLEGTAPYHWSGDVPGIEGFATEVFQRRMGGQRLDPGQIAALRSWVTRIPSPPPSRARDAAAAERGKALFEDPAIGCAGCHSGPRLTNNETVDVGTVAFSRDGEHLVLIAAGNGHTTELPQVQLIPVASASAEGGCVIQPSSHNDGFRLPTDDPSGQSVAVAFTPDDRIVVFTREPAAVHVRALADLHSSANGWTTIPVGGVSREDTGHAIFHSNTGGNIACVSCHPGGGDDGRVWQLSVGPRRTQSLQGTLDGTAPYHWGGDATGIETFATDVFASKMGGPSLAAPQVEALRSWLHRLPAPPASAALDAEAIVRGKATFESEAVGCATCHSGPKRTNNESVDVGTGGVFQVPPLVGLGNRAPYLHDGRATTLLDVVTRDGADSHGKTSVLSNAELLDLALYLDSL